MQACGGPVTNMELSHIRTSAPTFEQEEEKEKFLTANLFSMTGTE